MNPIDVHENVPLANHKDCQKEDIKAVLKSLGIVPGDFAIDETDVSYEVTLVSKSLLNDVRNSPMKVNDKFLNFTVPGIQSYLI